MSATSSQSTSRLRRQSWRGLKAPVKRVLSLPGVHAVMRTVAPHWRRPLDLSRLPAPSGVKHVQADMAGVRFDMLRPDRCILAKELYWGAGSRPKPQDQLALDVFAAMGQDADLVLDVGAYTGIFSLLAARSSASATVHAFEVVPTVFLAAWQNVIHNDLVGRVSVHLCGVGAEDSSVRMPTGEGGSALPDYLSTDMGFEVGVAVPIRSLDGVGREVGGAGPFRRVLMKVDVEGRELDVFENGTTFLGQHHPDIVCEVLPDADGKALTGLLRSLGYRFYLVEATSLTEHDEISGHPDYRDWLFTRAAAAELTARGVPVG